MIFRILNIVWYIPFVIDEKVCSTMLLDINAYRIVVGKDVVLQK